MEFGFHRALAKRFPFGIYYRVEGAIVRVYAVLDLRRDPGLDSAQVGLSGRVKNPWERVPPCSLETRDETVAQRARK
jgi:hypothetical protein